MHSLCYFFLLILTQARSSNVSVIGIIGQNVILPCQYDTQTHPSILSVCWGRGEVPRFHCSDTIISSQDGLVHFSQSSRYQLLGVTDGDMSLTILNAQWSDAGVYGCRVKIPGWFNDYKVNAHLVMVEATVEEPVTQDWIPPTEDEQSALYRNTDKPAPKSLEVGEPSLAAMGRIPAKEKFLSFLDVGNIVRMGVIFFSTSSIIFLFTFWRRFWPERTLQHINTSAAENIYESIQVV
uniref:LOW QUALITY PROTEIN: hepatitis A virus cellular receptor 1 homolog n=1 Tax=Monopterus albus TaxID=43700 RepID=UPI0009B469B5|nr:LOW QUALITY PROTEIN: hepatitis A virus cellular receptor 1 homolog [Monopterus albus]